MVLTRVRGADGESMGNRRRLLVTVLGMDRALAFVLLRRLGRELGRSIAHAVCPEHCPGCGRESDGLCDACAARLEVRRPPWCTRCGEPLLAPGAACPGDHGRIRGIVVARAPLRYRGTAGSMVRRFKFERDPACAQFMSRAMADALRGWARGPGRRGIVVSVPLHRRKLRRRGFDQAAVLAEGVASRLRLRFRPRALVRRRDTLPQGDPRVTSRENNVAGAFAAGRTRAVRGRMVILVDDVCTSGHTGRACAQVLREAGARGVALLTAARA